MNLLFTSNIVEFLLKTNGGETEGLIFYFCSLECFNCRRGGGGLGQKVLCRVG